MALALFTIVAVMVGFIAVIAVMRPGVEGIVEVHALFPVTGAFGAAVVVISVRELSQTESTSTLLVYRAVFVGVLAGVPLFWLWLPPDLPGLPLLLTNGVLATIDQ